MTDNPYSLKNLDSYIPSQEMIRRAMAEVEAAKQAYRDKYGTDEGERRYRADRADASRKAIRCMVNERIYFFLVPIVSFSIGFPVMQAGSDMRIGFVRCAEIGTTRSRPIVQKKTRVLLS